MIDEIIIRMLIRKMVDNKVIVTRAVPLVWDRLPSDLGALKELCDKIKSAPPSEVDRLKEEFFAKADEVWKRIKFLEEAEGLFTREIDAAARGDVFPSSAYEELARTARYYATQRKRRRR